MLVTKCQCGMELVFDAPLAGAIHECPSCLRPIQITGGKDETPADATPPSLLTCVCGCGKMLVVEEATAGQMVRCPACDRLLGTLHEFGTEHWHGVSAAKPAADQPPPLPTATPEAKQPPAPQPTWPLVFRYSRGGLPAILCGLLMLVTLTLPWQVPTGQSTSQAVSPVQMIQASLAKGGELAAPMFAPGELKSIVLAWAAGTLAVLAGVILKGQVRALLITAGALCAACFILQDMLPAIRESGPLDVSYLGALSLFLLVPLFVLTNLRLRVGPRSLVTFLLGIFAAIVAASAVTSIVLLGQKFFVGDHWPVGAGAKVGQMWDFVQQPMVLVCEGLTLAGLLSLLQALLRKLNTLMVSLITMVVLVIAGCGAAALAMSSGTWFVANVTVLIAGTAVLLIMGLTDAIAAILATPDDWRTL